VEEESAVMVDDAVQPPPAPPPPPTAARQPEELLLRALVAEAPEHFSKVASDDDAFAELRLDAALAAWDGAAAVGPGRCCPPRHTTHSEPSFLELRWRGEHPVTARAISARPYEAADAGSLAAIVVRASGLEAAMADSNGKGGTGTKGNNNRGGGGGGGQPRNPSGREEGREAAAARGKAAGMFNVVLSALDLRGWGLADVSRARHVINTHFHIFRQRFLN
jgi:hypothetical protein